MHSPQGSRGQSRADALAALAREQFDVLVVGGGITGAGVAREAAMQGWRTALVERDDFAAGTSSRSSRLVHGGVRYLEHGHLGLVFESSRERRRLLSLAPHLVRPLAFTWPVYRGARIPRWKVRAGLLLYDALAMFRNVQSHEGLSARGVLAYEPALAREALQGGARYWDAATNDTRLTLATILGAQEEGATVANHVSVTGAMRSENGRMVGTVVRDALSLREFEVRAHVVINATGPWSDQTAALTGESAGHQVLGSAGTHIAVPRARVGNHEAVTVVSPLDGRVMFVLPAGPNAIIGTTERPALSSPDEIRATESDVAYLLASVNRLFPQASLTRDDVVSAWCGIRPLAMVRLGEHSANSASREHAIAHRGDGLVSVTGGKLTTYRAMAEDVVKHAAHELAIAGALPSQVTAVIPGGTPSLPGGAFSSRESLMEEARAATGDHTVGDHLSQAYGTDWRAVWQRAQGEAALSQPIAPGLPYIMAEVSHAVQHELACTLSDVLIRRTHIAFETRDHGRSAARRIAPLMSTALGWSDEQQQRALVNYDADATRIFSIDG